MGRAERLGKYSFSLQSGGIFFLLLGDLGEKILQSRYDGPRRREFFYASESQGEYLPSLGAKPIADGLGR
jgi:hypothetical protein